jgi:hypothetical protein
MIAPTVGELKREATVKRLVLTLVVATALLGGRSPRRRTSSSARCTAAAATPARLVIGSSSLRRLPGPPIATLATEADPEYPIRRPRASIVTKCLPASSENDSRAR